MGWLIDPTTGREPGYGSRSTPQPPPRTMVDLPRSSGRRSSRPSPTASSSSTTRLPPLRSSLQIGKDMVEREFGIPWATVTWTCSTRRSQKEKVADHLEGFFETVENSRPYGEEEAK